MYFNFNTNKYENISDTETYYFNERVLEDVIVRYRILEERKIMHQAWIISKFRIVIENYSDISF